MESVWTAANPVASVKEFHLIMNTVARTIIEIPICNSRKSTFTDVGNGFGDKNTLLAETFENHL